MNGEQETSGLPEPIVHQVAPPPPPQPSLEDIAKALAPLADGYYAHQERMHERSLEHEKRELKVDELQIAADERRDRRLLVAGTVIAMAVMVIALVLIIRGQSGEARDLIQLVIAAGASWFGGYGYATIKARRAGEGEDE